MAKTKVEWKLGKTGVWFVRDETIHATVMPLGEGGHAEWEVVKLAKPFFTLGELVALASDDENCHSGIATSVERAKAAAEEAIDTLLGVA